MPIRTHRGRAAVYRRFWGWPLRSPKHLVGAVVLVVVLGSVVGFLLPDPPPGAAPLDDDSGAVPSSVVQQPDPTEESVVDTGSPPSISVPTESPPQTEPSPEGLEVVRQWGGRWVDHPEGTTQREWLEKLRPYTTEEFMGVMSTVEPANVTATELTGQPQPKNSTNTSMRVLLPTNGSTLRVHVVRTVEGWRVAGYDKVS